MKVLKYIGGNQIEEVAGCAMRPDRTVEVPDAAAEALVRDRPTEFQYVEETKPKK